MHGSPSTVRIRGKSDRNLQDATRDWPCNHGFIQQETALKKSPSPWATRAAIVGLATAAMAGCGGSGGDSGSLPAVADNISVNPGVACTMQGIGATALSADAPVSILEVSTGTTGTAASDKP